MKTVNMIVVAHPDDEILGFGATGAKLSANGHVVQPVILSGGVAARQLRPANIDLIHDIARANETVGFAEPVLGEFPNIQMNTVPHIELVQFIERKIEKFQPHRIFTHHPADLNDDHRQVARSCMAAFRIFQRKPKVYATSSLHFMEIASATDWAMDTSLAGFRPNLYVEITKELDAKLKALMCYRGVMRDYPHSRSVESIRGLASYRGSQSGQYYSEAFETVFQRELS